MEKSTSEQDSVIKESEEVVEVVKEIPEENPKPEKQENPKLASPKSKSQIKGNIRPIVSLNDFNQDAESDLDEDVLDFEDQEFTKEDLQKAMSDYADMLDAKKKIGEAKLLRNDFEYEEGNIFIIIDSPVDESRYNDIKSDLLLQLRKSVKNKSLQLDIKRVELEKIKTVYTPQEKFDYLSQKNPALIELKKRLGLEFEF